jgi:tetratricopeptide (TPR) repeat protein
MLQGDPGSSNLGDLDGSVTSLEKAIAVASRPQEGDRDDVKVAVTIARAHQSAARILVARYVRGGRAEDDAKRSIDHSEQALDILEDLVEGDPANTFLREKLADALLADATVNTFLERNELSIEALRRAEKIWRELAAEGVATVDCLDLSLSRCLYDQGRLFGNPYSTYDGKDPAKARECLEESMGLAQKCVKESPDSTAAVNAVLLSTTALAPLAEDPERGLALYGQALELTGRLRELDPTDARSLNGRGLVLRNMGKLQVRMGEPEAAAVTFGRAIETFEELAALRGAAREAAPLAMLHERQARILIELDQLEDVVSHFDEALRHWAVYCKPSAGEQCANLHVPHAYERAASSLKAIGRDQDVARLGRDAEAVYECIDVERVGLFSFHESRATLRVLHADALAQLDEPAQARRLYGLALADVEAALPVAPDAKGRETLAARAEVLREKASSTDD